MEARRYVVGALATELDGVRVDHRARRVEDVPGERPVLRRAGGAVEPRALLDGVAAAVDRLHGVAHPLPDLDQMPAVGGVEVLAVAAGIRVPVLGEQATPEVEGGVAEVLRGLGRL